MSQCVYRTIVARPTWKVLYGYSRDGIHQNRPRFLVNDLAQRWSRAVVVEAHEAQLTDADHFSVDGTLIQAWASENRYRPKEDPPSRRTGRGGKLLKRDVFENSTDLDARLYRKSARSNSTKVLQRRPASAGTVF